VGQSLMCHVFRSTDSQHNSVLQTDSLSWNSNKLIFSALQHCETAVHGYNGRYLVQYPGIYINVMLQLQELLHLCLSPLLIKMHGKACL